MNSLEELGKKAYQKQIWGDYIEAINIYNTTIEKYPNDPRLLNNRCLCYIEIKNFNKALEDAERMIHHFPQHAKSYYRKGEVLAALKRYIEAEESFQKVLSMDLECEDARRQLLNVQAMHLCQLGYNKEQALKALRLTINSVTHTASIEDAENILKYGTQEILDQNSDIDSDCVYYSDDDDNGKKEDRNVYDPFVDPSNPLKSSTLWVGFVTKSVTKDMLQDLFSEYGKIDSVHVCYPLHCAFINYINHIAPGKAMKALQGKFIGGRNIVLKFPNRAASQTNKHTKAL
ncbi:uncharacterized protein LOC110835369 isoform X2 [Zootermopsis nevadensis]|nr:uncharacterized protein LOC110835369 isoform X2 [Zootermopsis nevadensis]XP_021931234.1 uncharacterized protein LOC110835369 isoform X2 [Zootermopsis nevadensis]